MMMSHVPSLERLMRAIRRGHSAAAESTTMMEAVGAFFEQKDTLTTSSGSRSITKVTGL